MSAGRPENASPQSPHLEPPGDLLPAAEGRSGELEAIYRAEGPRLLRIVARRAGSSEEARDIVQEAFCKLVRIGQGLPLGLQRPQAYLRRIAVNLLKDRAKMAERRSAALHVVADEDQLPAVDPHVQLECRDMLNRLDRAMLRLKPKTREIFMAHRIEGMTYAEIADRTGLSVKGVEKQMSRALAQLDRLLERG